MDILFIGRFYPKGLLSEIVSDTRGKVGFSNHNFEKSLISGFSKLADVNLRVVTAPMAFSFPHNNKRAFIHKEFYPRNNYTVRSTGFCNLIGLNMLSGKIALKKAIRREIKMFEGDELVIVVNTPSLLLSSALFEVLPTIVNKKITTVLIVPDVPECMLEMDGKLSLKGRIVQRLNKLNAKLSHLYDKYVYLTEAMNDFYHADKKDYIVMEGLIDDSKFTAEYEPPKYDNKEIILYTGTLRRIFGVTFLLDVFEKGKFPNTELWICGSGEAAEEIAERAKLNPNIKFFGLVNAEKARELQSQATILANPRSSEGRYTRYSFPSKTIEYLLAGKTVVMNRLPGIPDDYDNYLHYPADESEEAWIEKLNEILRMSETQRKTRDKAGKDYILNNKTDVKQCRRIVSLAFD